MILTLEVAGTSLRATFRGSGGKIGRAPGSSLLLSDEHVSGHHADIAYRAGTYYVEDRSRNGMYLDGNRLKPRQPVELRSGSVMVIESYEIRVTVAADVQAVIPTTTHDSLLGESESGSSSGLTGFLGNAGPAAGGAAPLIPPNWNDESGIVASPEPGPEPLPTPPPRPSPPTPVPPSLPRSPQPKARHRPAAAGGSDGSLAQVLAGAGLRPEDVTPELAEDLGRILRVVVEGVMDVLAARQQTKEEFRVGVTTFKRAGSNNPLKFSSNLEDALHKLFVQRQEGYLGPIEAFEDAFEDLRNHQVATLDGMRKAFAAMLKRFDPQKLQERFDRQQRGALVSVPGRLRYWDLYGDWFRDMVGDADSFQELFGEEFAEAYDRQLRNLKGRRAGEADRDKRP
jgi:type VI secretion system FHA domain protein